MTSKVMDVVVIGCGASGIAALRKLHDAGLKAVGLEAADRIGGRICTVEFGAAAVDIGAAWCEGDDNNAVFDLANPLDLLEPERSPTKWFVSSNGELVPTELASDIVKGFDEAINSADKTGTKSISECVSTSVNNIESFKKSPNLAKSFVEWYERNNHVGGQNDPKEGKSLRGIEECFVDRNVMLNWKGRGYKTVLDILLASVEHSFINKVYTFVDTKNKYPDPSKELPIKILLNKEVVSIKWRTNQPGRETGVPLVHVKCNDGSLFAAKSVIVTVSIGVLKRKYAQLFNPPLPTEKVNTINNLQLCVLGKIYIEFTEAWWPKTPASFAILWRDEDKAKFSADEKWITEIYGLDTVAHQPNVLLTWIYGNGALQMEKASEQEVKDGIIKLLDSVLKKQFKITPVKSILRTQWGSDPLTGGAYAYRSVALEEKGGSAAILSEPLCQGNGFPVVCFAGEATSYRNHGAVHGAIEAGYREADRLIESFKDFSI